MYFKVGGNNIKILSTNDKKAKMKDVSRRNLENTLHGNDKLLADRKFLPKAGLAVCQDALEIWRRLWMSRETGYLTSRSCKMRTARG